MAYQDIRELIAYSMYDLDAIERTAAHEVRKYLNDTARSCCGERGSAVAVDPETGCTAAEMLLGNGVELKVPLGMRRMVPSRKNRRTVLDLFRAVINVSRMEELRLSLRAHWGAECVVCDSTRKAVMEDRSVLGTREVSCCEATPRTEVA